MPVLKNLKEKIPAAIAIDLDNTIVNYDDVMRAIAGERGFLFKGECPGKIELRDRVRERAGDLEWQHFQALAYGARMPQAVLFDGVLDFFRVCEKKKIKTFIVSHKTEFSPVDETHTNLRQVALTWLSNHGFSTGNVFFENSREEKIRRVVQLGCEWLIDDLVETFAEKTFPAAVGKLLFSPSGGGGDLVEGVVMKSSWKEICHFFFDV